MFWHFPNLYVNYFEMIFKMQIHNEVIQVEQCSISKVILKSHLSFLTWSCICQLFQPNHTTCLDLNALRCHAWCRFLNVKIWALSYWQSYCFACSGIIEVWREYMQQSFIICHKTESKLKNVRPTSVLLTADVQPQKDQLKMLQEK